MFSSLPCSVGSLLACFQLCLAHTNCTVTVHPSKTLDTENFLCGSASNGWPTAPEANDRDCIRPIQFAVEVSTEKISAERRTYSRYMRKVFLHGFSSVLFLYILQINPYLKWSLSEAFSSIVQSQFLVHLTSWPISSLEQTQLLVLYIHVITLNIYKIPFSCHRTISLK